MSEYYAIQRSDEYLTHYGVRGMKWGVRKYLDRSGNETNRSLSRYGPNAYRHSSARKIQRDFNRLDQSYANVNAERIDQSARLNRLANKMLRKGAKYNEKGMASEKMKQKLEKKYKNKMQSTAKRLSEAEAQMRGIERIQMRAVGTAAKNKYDVEGKQVYRLGRSSKDKRQSTLAALAVGGALAGGVYGITSALNGKNKMVMGNRIKVRKNGTGKVSLVNYSEMNKKYGGGTPTAPRHGKKRRNIV